MAADLAAIHAEGPPRSPGRSAPTCGAASRAGSEAASVRVADWTTDEHDEYRSGTG
ncbi:MAG: hypothetical protein WDN24_07495 [Sphingomonas sp.]